MNLIRIGLIGFSGVSVILAPLGASAQIKEIGPTLDIRFEPSGTHVEETQRIVGYTYDEKGTPIEIAVTDEYLKIRLDFYPKPEDKSYAQQHVYVIDATSLELLKGYPGETDKEGTPIDPLAYQKWVDSLPHIWQTNPTLSHFVTVSPDITKETLDAWIKTTFTADVTATIDASAIEANSAHLLSPYMKTKTEMNTAKIRATEDTKVVVDTVNANLAGYALSSGAGGAIQPIQPQSIDMGYGTAGFADGSYSPSTRVDKYNPANATGTIDTWQLWFYGGSPNPTSVKVATFYLVSGTNLSTRAYASLGTVTAGSVQTFTGLSVAVTAGDFVGSSYHTGALGTKFGSFTGIYYYASEQIPCTNLTFNYVATSTTYAMYATGSEGWTNILYVGGIDQSTISTVGGVSFTDIGTIAGVTP